MLSPVNPRMSTLNKLRQRTCTSPTAARSMASIATIAGNEIAKKRTISSPIHTSTTSNIKHYVRRAVLSVSYPMDFVSKLPSTTTDGVWYLSPEHHVLESLMALLTAMCILHFTSTMTQSTDHIANSSLNPEGVQSYTTHFLKCALTADYALHIFYKMQDPPIGRGIWWMLQPCPMNQLYILILLYFPCALTPSHLLHILTLTAGAFNALAFPDYQSTRRLSVFHFWFQHLIIVAIPWMWFLQYLHTMAPLLSLWSVVRTHSLGVLYQFGLEVMCMLSGVNINYQFAPPKPLRILGNKYRIVMLALWFLLNVITGYVLPSVAVWVIAQGQS